jgi:hypothetical protein
MKHKLDGFFVNPLLTSLWDSCDKHLQRMKQIEIKKVVFQWTTAYGYSLYPSSIYPLGWLSFGDLIGNMLDVADDIDMQIWLGLDACQTITEEHYDPVKGATSRCCNTASELITLYGKHRSLTGFYIPFELTPSLHTESLIEKVASHCHSLEKPVLCSTHKPRLIPEGRHYEFNEKDQEWIAREKILLQKWADSWKKLVKSSGLDILMLSDQVGVLRQQPEAIADDLQHLKDSPKLWLQTSIYRATRDIDDHDPISLHPTEIERLQKQLEASDYAEACIGFSYHDMEWERGERQHKLYQDYLKYINGISIDSHSDKPIINRTEGNIQSSLLDKARQTEQLIHEKCMLHDQIITVVDTRYTLESVHNQWQEDADWLTGLYVGAESLRYATTGEDEAKQYAQSSWRALHKLSNISGIPGIVARHYRKNFDGDLGTGRKRWHLTKDGFYWIGDISRDQLSGHIFGLAAYYDLVASQDERLIIKSDVEAITDLIIENNMVAVDWDGQPCIHGNFWVSPLFALSFLKTAYHITQKERYQQKYLELIDPHYFLGHALKDARVSANPFFQHYHQDSPLYHLLQYETDSRILHYIMRCIELLYEDTRRHGNVYLMFDYAICHPESEAGRKGVTELLEFDVSHLNVAKWDHDARKYMNQNDIPAKVRRSLKYMLEPDTSLPNGKGNYIPLKYRPPKEFGWNYYSGEEAHSSHGKAGHHGINVQYSGVDYLLVYWMGRYHELI